MHPNPSITGFRIVDKLGEGGMGSVWKAIHESSGRTVALKLIANDIASYATARERFQREARLAVGIRHPHVVACLGSGREGAHLWMAMELVSGSDARQLCRQHGGKLQEAVVAGIVRDAALGLAAMHGAGLVHRDVKPSNILVVEVTGQAKICDLGLARPAVSAEHLTSSGVAVGTPEFMSPEQARGGEIDARSDIYSLGTALYALACGQSPYRGSSAWEVAAAVINDPFPDPREAQVSEELARIIVTACAKDPNQRYADATAMAADLTSFLARESGMKTSLAGASSKASTQSGQPAGLGIVVVTPRRWAWSIAVIASAAVGLTVGLLWPRRIVVAQAPQEHAAQSTQAPSLPSVPSDGSAINTTTNTTTASTGRAGEHPSPTAWDLSAPAKPTATPTASAVIRIPPMVADIIEIIPLVGGMPIQGGDIFPLWPEQLPVELQNLQIARPEWFNDMEYFHCDVASGARIVVFVPLERMDLLREYSDTGWRELTRCGVFIPFERRFTTGMALTLSGVLLSAEHLSRAPADPGKASDMYRAMTYRAWNLNLSWQKSRSSALETILREATRYDPKRAQDARLRGTVGAPPPDRDPPLATVHVGSSERMRAMMRQPAGMTLPTPPLSSTKGQWIPLFAEAPFMSPMSENDIRSASLIVENAGTVYFHMEKPNESMGIDPAHPRVDSGAIWKATIRSMREQGWTITNDGQSLECSRWCNAGEYHLLPYPTVTGAQVFAESAEGVPNPMQGAPPIGDIKSGLRRFSPRSIWGQRVAPFGKQMVGPKTIELRFRGGQWALDAKAGWQSPDDIRCPDTHRAAIWAYRSTDGLWRKIVVLPANTFFTRTQIQIPEGFDNVFLRMNDERLSGLDARLGEVWYEFAVTETATATPPPSP